MWRSFKLWLVAFFWPETIARLQAKIQQLQTNQTILVGVMNMQRTYVMSLEQRLCEHAKAINAIANHPTCPQALGARLARIELMILPGSWDTPTGQQHTVGGGKS